MKSLLPSLLVTLLIAAPFANGSLFLSLPGLTGDVTTRGYTGTFEIATFSWNVELVPGQLPSLSDLSFTSDLGSQFSAIFNDLVSENLFPSAILYEVKLSPTGISTYVNKYTFTNLRFTSLGVDTTFTDAQNGTILESFSMDFEKITISSYTSSQQAVTHSYDTQTHVVT